MGGGAGSQQLIESELGFIVVMGDQARALPEARITRRTLTKNCEKYNCWNQTNDWESDRSIFDKPKIFT